MSFNFITKSGNSLNFRQHNFNELSLSKNGGIYIFANFDRIPHELLYIGITDCFMRRMREHRDTKWREATSLGATCVLACVVESERLRLCFEKELIESYRPRLNIVKNPCAMSLSDVVYRDKVESTSRMGLSDFVYSSKAENSCQIGLSEAASSPKLENPFRLSLLDAVSNIRTIR